MPESNRDNAEPKPKPAKPPKRLQVESLEERILMSGTWVDADTGGDIDGATSGDDVYTGSLDGDIAEGGDGADDLFGDAGNDYLDGGAGNDTVSGGEGDDVVSGNAGDDTLAGGTGDDLIIGGEGTDTATYKDASSGVEVDLSTGTATGEGSDTLLGIENVTGSSHADTLTGDDGANVINAGDGNDDVFAGDGDDTVSGDDGDDDLYGGDGDDVIDGGRGRDDLYGDAGDDTLLGGTGYDDLYGGSGDDLLDGGTQSDDLYGGSGSDTLIGGSGNDDLYGEAGDDVLRGGTGNDDLDGGDGIDTADYADSTDDINASLATGQATGDGNDTLTNIENVTTGSGDDTLTGDANNNVLNAGSGDDTIDGGAGADTLLAGAGDDTIISDGLDTIDAGSGHDTVDFSSAAGPVTFDVVDANAETVIGTGQGDTFGFNGASDGDAFTIQQGAGSTIDLSDYAAEDVAIDTAAGTITVQLGGGASFEIAFDEIGQVQFAGDAAPGIFVSDAVVSEATSVTLSGVGFSSGDGDLTYAWTQVFGPAVDLTDADTNAPSFDTPELATNGTLRFRVDVSDGDTTTTQYVSVGVTADNDPVVVDTGPDQIVTEGTPVSLASSVVDPEGKTVLVGWTQVSGPAVDLAGADSASPTFDAPNLEADAELVFEVTASDGENTTTQQVTVTVEAANDAVLVDAGNDRSVNAGGTVQLGAVATDPDSPSLTYSWQQVGGPTVAMTGADGATPVFTAPDAVVNTDLTFEVSVTDGETVSTDTVTVTVSPVDNAPRFTHAPNYSIGENEVVTFSATAVDPEGKPLTYSWEQIGGPEVTIDFADTQTPSITTPEKIVNSYLTFEVSASDGVNTTVQTINVLVEADNDAPVVDAGANATIEGGTYGELSATASDPEGKALAYSWTQIGGPDAPVLAPGSANPQFLAPDVSEPTELTYQVSVTDGRSTTVDTVTIFVDANLDGSTGDSDSGTSDSGSGDSGTDTDTGGSDTPAEGPLVVETPAKVFVNEGELATLHVNVPQATGDVSYAWTQTAGSQDITLTDADTASPNFVVPEHVDNEIYIFEAEVTDDTGTRTVQVTLQVNADNDGPTINIDDEPTANDRGLLNIGSAVNDPEGQNVSYSWSQIAGPELRLADDNAASLTFSAKSLDEPAEVTFQLTASDGTSTTTEQVTLWVDPSNADPIVDAGADQFVDEGTPVTLHAVASDADGDALTYAWVQTSGPEVTLDDPAAASPTFTAPMLAADEAITFELTVSDGDVAVTDSVTIHVAADNDPPIVDAGPFQSVDEGDTVQLTATGNDPDGDTLTYTWTQVSGPSVAITGADSANASFTAPEDVTNTFVAFDVTASDGEHTVVDRVYVLVNADNDAPTLNAGADFSAEEETVVQLNATAADPEGQDLMHTWRQTSGPEVALSDTGTLDPTFIAPNVLEPTEVTFEVTTTDGEHTVVDTITVTITGDNDAATPTDATTIVPEDTPTPVTFHAVDPDYGDTVEQFRIDALPADGALTANGVGVQVGDTFTAAEIEAGVLQFDPPADWNGTTSLEFSASDGELWATGGTQSIVVQGVADAPVVTAADVSVTEDASVALPIQVDLTDTDGSESISKVEITGAPNGTTFSDGTTTVTVSNGKADVSDLDLSALTISPAGDHDTDFTVTIAATSTEADSGDSAVGTTQVDVHITAVNDAPKTSDTTVQGSEDTTLTVIPKAYEVDTGDTVDTFRIESLPDNGTLMFNGSPVTAGDVIDAEAVRTGQLTFEPASDWSGTTSFDFSAADDDVWSDGSGTLTIEIEGVADSPLLTASDVSVTEDGSAPIPLAPSVADTDGSETISEVTISGAPIGTVFTDGAQSVTVQGSSVDVTGWDLANLEITPAPNYDVDFSVDVSVTATEADGDTETTTAELQVHVAAVNDAPIVNAGEVSVGEDQPATIRLSASEVDTGDAIEGFRIDALPANGTLTLDGVAVAQGEVLDASAVDAGGLVFTPTEHWSGDTSLTFSAYDGEAFSETQGEFAIAVSAEADAPTLSVTPASGIEDQPIALNIDSALVDTDGSERLRIMISDVPDGAELSGGWYTGNNTWTLKPEDLDGLTITPPDDFSGSFDLKVQANAMEDDDYAYSSKLTLGVTVEAVADAPNLSVADVSGSEDQPIALDIDSSLADTDGSETLSVRIEGVPDGATLSAGVDNGDGSWALASDQLDGLTITPPENFSGEFDLTVMATATDGDDTATTTETLGVTVEAVADAPTLTTADASGTQGQPVGLTVDATLTDASETLSIRIEGVPDGSTLSAGVDNGDGSWTLTPDQLDGLTLQPSAGVSGDFDLTVIATSVDGTSEASVDAVLSVHLEPLPDAAPPDTPQPAEPDEPAEPSPNRPEVDWSGDELASVAEGLDEIEEKVVELASDVQEMVDELSVIDLGEAGEYTLVYEAGEPMPDESPEPAVQPSGFLYESSRGEATEAEEPQPRAFESADERETPTAFASEEQEPTVRERVTNALGGLFGLVRSIGPRDSQDEQRKN